MKPLLLAFVVAAALPASGDDLGRLTAALRDSHALERDIAYLNDAIGGRPTGSAANQRAVAWAESRFREIGVTVHREPFTMPARWLERSARATVQGADVSFSARIAAMPFSTGTGPEGITAPLLDAGRGTPADFAKLGARASGAFVLIEQDLLADIEGLFKEYIDTAAIEQRAFAAKVAGVVYMASRPSGILYRHNVAVGDANTRPMVILEREAAMRARRILQSGVPLTLTEVLDIDRGGSYTAENVVADIPGRSGSTDVVLMGAHLDSWDLGGGTLDNGANAALIIDLARAIHELKLQPARSIRLVLWNGEEQGMIGSREYVRAHRADLDHIVLAGTIDTGCGQVTGWVTGGRPDVTTLVDRLIAPAASLGPFTQVTDAMSGTDHFDFMLEGIPNVVANQATATYGPNYHAASDQFEQCDLREQRLNSARVAALVWQAANDTTRLPRQSRTDIQSIIDHTDLGAQMKAFGEYEDWTKGLRGRVPSQ
jgi:hypothetical protein